MSQNVTWFGDAADQHDTLVRDSERILDAWVERGNFSVPRMAAASSVVAFMRFGQSFTDLLRLGKGVASGTIGGLATDGLRLLTITGIGGAAVGRLSRVLVVEQAANTMTCSWVTTANALRRSGQRFFVSLEELAKAAGVSLPKITATGSGAPELKALVDALRRMAIPVRQVLPVGTALEQVEQLARANRGAVLVFALRYGGRYAHQLYATCSGAGLVIVDTTGVVYRGLGALRKAYPGADLAGLPREAFFVIENAGIITAANAASAGGGLSSVALELVSVTKPPEPTLPTRH